MTNPIRYNETKGIGTHEVIAAAVTIGIKDRKQGFPVERDRFHIVLPRETDGRREPHPAFARFNSAPPEHRRTIKGVLVHATEAECFQTYYRAQVLRKGQKGHPNRLPMCQGDGERATRWEGGDPDDFMEIRCPNEKCEFRQMSPAMCKPFTKLIFMLRWKDDSGLPQLPVKFTTGSYYSTVNIKSFFKELRDRAKQLGLDHYSLFGLPFQLTLREQTKPSQQRKFPVVDMTPEDFDPVAFFTAQRQQIRELQAPVVSLLDGPETEPAIEAEDYRIISPAPAGVE